MPRRGKRKRLATGIFEDLTGRSVIVRGKEKRFPPHTPMSVLRADYDRRKRKGGIRRIARGTLRDDVARWEPLEQHLASWMERRAELHAWCKLYGDRQRYDLTDADVRTAIGIWTQDGIAPKTIRNRLWSLKRLYKVLDGPDAETPCDHVRPPAKVRHVITPVDAETILTVYRNLLEQERKGILRDAKTRARFMVRAATGRRPKEIMRAKPEDVDLERRICRVRDAKGGWSEGLYLNDDMVIAWQTFTEADAWGDFNTGGMATVLQNAGWPKHIRPYNLRHSIGIGLSELGHDLADVGGWLGHSDVRTTRSAYVPVLQGRMQRLSESLSGRLKGWIVAPVPSSVPQTPAPTRSKLLHNKHRPAAADKAKVRRKV
jgi:site-specific recombinase XerD